MLSIILSSPFSAITLKLPFLSRYKVVETMESLHARQVETGNKYLAAMAKIDEAAETMAASAPQKVSVQYLTLWLQSKLIIFWSQSKQLYTSLHFFIRFILSSFLSVRLLEETVYEATGANSHRSGVYGSYSLPSNAKELRARQRARRNVIR